MVRRHPGGGFGQHRSHRGDRPAAGAVVQRDFDSFAGQRNHAMAHGGFRNDWVLHLDADEVVPAALMAELQAIAGSQQPDALIYRLPSRLIFMGRWLRHAGMYPAYQVRFGHKEALRFVDYGHGQREAPDGQAVGTCSAALDHYNFSKGVNDWFARHLRYARLEAQQAIEEAGDALALCELAARTDANGGAPQAIGLSRATAALMRFLYVYLLKRGFLDGAAGFSTPP